MAVIRWNEKFCVGVVSIDVEHKKLVGYFNELQKVIEDGKGAELLVPALNNLVEFCKEHFATEEKLFALTKYPETEEHLKEHQDLMFKVQHYCKLLASRDTLLASELLDFLRDWVMMHILVCDMKYKNHFLANGIK